MLEVRLDSWLRGFGPPSRVKLEADTLAHLLDELEARYPRFRFKVRDEAGALGSTSGSSWTGPT
jgi:hypothetical protein